MSDTKPTWIEQWTSMRDDGKPYDELLIVHMRRFAQVRPDVRAAMLKYPPHSVITFTSNQETSYGVVTGVCLIAPDKQPKKSAPLHVVAIRFVPSPLHLNGALGQEERNAAYVMPEGVDVVGYSPRYTPATMRALIAPSGSA